MFKCRRPKSLILPLSRVNNSYPFICTGIEYAGAIYCRSICFRNVKWEFSLTEALWYEGFWKSLVEQLKRCLKMTIDRAYLNFYELQTVTNEIELVLNSRPLGLLQDDDLEEPLTPNHLLYGRQLHFDNYNDSVEGGVFDAHKRKEYLEAMLNHFRNRWFSEHIPSLLEYQKLYK